jgi:hypothetical protein
MGVLKRWSKEVFTEEKDGIDFSCEVKCLNVDEAPEFLTQMATFAEASAAMGGGGEGVTPARVKALYSAVPGAFIKDSFTKYLRNIRDLADEDGKPFESGEEIAGAVTHPQAMAILGRIQRRAAGITETEGKASASPSISGSEATASSSSPALSTESEGGETPTDATPIPEIPVESVPSTGGV